MQDSGEEALLAFLPPENSSEIKKLYTPKIKKHDLVNCGYNNINYFHNSWLKDDESIYPLIHKNNYFLNLFLDEIRPPEILPQELLPTTPLDDLLKFKHQDFVEVITLLGIYDLALELKNIIDKETIKQAFSILSSEHQKFLIFCLKQKQQKPQKTSKKLLHCISDNLNMQRMLHQHGLIKLSMILSTTSPSFIWHICHILDTTRGNFILKFSSKKASTNVAKILTEQLLTAISSKTKT